MIDLLYLAYNRLEFTRKSFDTMLANTSWTNVDRLLIYDDGSTDGTREFLEQQAAVFRFSPRPGAVQFIKTEGLGPVGVMNHYLATANYDGTFAKIDNDVMLPPRWLEESLALLGDPSIDLLGIEAVYPTGAGRRQIEDAAHIGGIGLMRLRAFSHCVPKAQGRMGFTAWQLAHPELKKGWINPSLAVCLLNLLPFEPWKSLSTEYVKNKWQRDWPGPYVPESKSLWEWWA